MSAVQTVLAAVLYSSFRPDKPQQHCQNHLDPAQLERTAVGMDGRGKVWKAEIFGSYLAANGDYSGISCT